MNSSARLPSQTDRHLHESQSLRNSTAALGRQSRSNWSLPIVSAKREFSRKGPETFGNFAPEIGRLETKSNARKAGISGPVRRGLQTIARRKTGWLGRQESNVDMAISKADALACPRGF